MNQTEGPTPKQMTQFYTLRGRLLGFVAAIVSDTEPEAQEKGTAIDATVQEMDAAVRGNRNDSVQPTWSDLKLMLRNQLQVCLEELEK